MFFKLVSSWLLHRNAIDAVVAILFSELAYRLVVAEDEGRYDK